MKTQERINRMQNQLHQILQVFGVGECRVPNRMMSKVYKSLYNVWHNAYAEDRIAKSQ